MSRRGVFALLHLTGTMLLVIVGRYCEDAARGFEIKVLNITAHDVLSYVFVAATFPIAWLAMEFGPVHPTHAGIVILVLSIAANSLLIGFALDLFIPSTRSRRPRDSP